MYATFTFSYSELAAAIPRAGGGFVYSSRALGKNWGFIAGMAQNIEFIFAPPAIALAIGAYFNLFIPGLPVLEIAVAAYILITALNIYGIKAAALFELIITILAVGELLLFAGLTLPHASIENLKLNALPNGYTGIFAAVPFAIWFFLGIEGVANVAEETINPQKTITRGFGFAILTLVILCMLTFAGSAGVAGWEAIVYKVDGTSSDSPLPLALGRVMGENNAFYHLLITVGLFGLVASFHGLILAAGRASFEFGKDGCAPAFIGQINSRFKTPANALLTNMGIGIIALFSGKTSEIITISVFGALTLYIISMVSVIKLRKTEPALHRPFKVPLFPLFPLIALTIAGIALLAMIWYNQILALIYTSILVLSFTFYKISSAPKKS
jgi:ethanolamine permease